MTFHCRKLIPLLVVFVSFVNLACMDGGQQGKPLTFTQSLDRGNKGQLLFHLKGNKYTVHHKDDKGYLPLHRVAMKGHLHLAELLVEKGAEVNAKGPENITPLLMAARSGHNNIVSFLLRKGANVNAKHSNGTTPLHSAAFEGHLAVVETLVANKAEINVSLSDGTTPLILTARKGHTEIAKVLLDKGADIEAPLSNKMTPLHAALFCKNEKTALMLIENGADINKQSDIGARALTIAVKCGLMKAINRIVAKGANVNEKSFSGMTPFKMAAKFGQVEAAKYLIAQGASFKAAKGETSAMELALAHKHFKIVELLSEKGEKINCTTAEGLPIFHGAAIGGDPALIDYFIQEGIKVDMKDSTGATPLHYVAAKGQVAMVKFLVSRGADIEIKRDTDGATPLIAAAESKTSDAAITLIDLGANAKEKRKDGKTIIEVLEELKSFPVEKVKKAIANYKPAIVRIAVKPADAQVKLNGEVIAAKSLVQLSELAKNIGAVGGFEHRPGTFLLKAHANGKSVEKTIDIARGTVVKVFVDVEGKKIIVRAK